MTLEFLDSETVTNAIYGEGTFEISDDELILLYENENEFVEIRLTLEESDKDGSEYIAEISDVRFEMEDMDKISYYRNLAYSFYSLKYVTLIKR